MTDEPRYISAWAEMKALEEKMCKKPVFSKALNDTLNCLLIRGHDGPCKSAIVKYEDPPDDVA